MLANCLNAHTASIKHFKNQMRRTVNRITKHLHPAERERERVNVSFITIDDLTHAQTDVQNKKLIVPRHKRVIHSRIFTQLTHLM